MKNFKRILIASLVAALVLVGCMVATFADDEYTGTLEDLTALVEKAENAADASKYAALSDVLKYLDEKPVDPATEGYDAIVDRISAVTVAAASADLAFASGTTVNAATAYTNIFKAQETLAMFEVKEDTAGFAEFKDKFDDALIKTGAALVAEVDENITTTLKTSQNQVAINKARRVLFDCELYGDSHLFDLYDLYADLAALEQKQEEAVAINLAAIEEENDITDYNLPTYYSFDVESLPVELLKKDGPLDKFGASLKSTNNPIGVQQEANGNKYVYSGYAPTDQSDKNTYVQLPLSGYSPDNGYVMEFDITTFDMLPAAGIKIEAGGFNMPDGRGFPPFYLVINSNGDFIMGDAPNAVDQNKVTAMTKAIVPGQWLHVAIIFDNVEFTYTLIVEGEKLATTSAKYKGDSFNLSEGVIRFSSADTSGSIAFDNFSLYSGTNYRNPDRFSNMTDDEMFVFYTSYLSDETRDVNGKNTAYDMATELLEKYWVYTNEETGEGDYTDYAKESTELMAAVDAYLGFDFESLLAVVKLQNLASLNNLVNELTLIERSPGSVGDRESKILEIDAFLDKYRGLINVEIDENENGVADYTECTQHIDTIRRQVTYDKNAVFFIRYMDRFQMVSATTAMQRYYDKAKALITAGEVDIGIATNPEHADRERFPEFVEAYQVYLSSYERIKEVTRKDNSSKIVTCIRYIDDFTTEEEWLENFDMMNRYLDIIKDAILYTDEDGILLYDESYEGVIEAVEFFNVVYTFFYNYKQDQHVSYMSGIFDLIFSTEAYIEKMGMVSLLDRYVAANELNYDDQRIISLLNALETVRSELQVRKEDYAKILVQNSVYFVNIVEDLRTAKTYMEKLALFEEASALYFNIDITVEGTTEAVEIYDKYKVELEQAQLSSTEFLRAYDYYEACVETDERYAALVECYYHAQYAEESYYGVSEALDAFWVEYDVYMDYVNEINGDVIAIGNLIGSLRANCGITPIIEIIIKQIYGV